MVQITGIFKAWLNAIFQLQLPFMIETSSRKYYLLVLTPKERLKRSTNCQKARGERLQVKNKICSKTFCLCSSLYKCKGNPILNLINQFFSSMHLNSSPINSSQGEILCRLSKKRNSSCQHFNIRNGKLENKTPRKIKVLYFQKKKYYPPALTATL